MSLTAWCKMHYIGQSILGAWPFKVVLQRTLILHHLNHLLQRNVPFTDWFKLESVQNYHKSLPLEDFMEQLAPEKWPSGNRTGYCFELSRNVPKSCNMKKEGMARTFWDELGVEFDNSAFVRLHSYVGAENFYETWMER